MSSTSRVLRATMLQYMRPDQAAALVADLCEVPAPPAFREAVALLQKALGMPDRAKPDALPVLLSGEEADYLHHLLRAHICSQTPDAAASYESARRLSSRRALEVVTAISERVTEASDQMGRRYERQ